MSSLPAQETRHYCKPCGAWMDNNLSSIRLHENGQRHKESVEKAMQEGRDARKRKDDEASALAKQLETIEEAAKRAAAADAKFGESSPVMARCCVRLVCAGCVRV